MIDFLAFIISLFLLGFVVLIILIGVKFFHSLATIGQSKNGYNKETDRQLIQSSRENSQLDLYMSTDEEGDELFPEDKL